MAGLINVGISGLLAYQRSLDTISHNIANVNTPGYSRQTVELNANRPQAHGSGFIGTGVAVGSVERSYDAFIEGSLRSVTSTQSEFESFRTLASQLDNVLADSDAGMSAVIQRLFNSVQDVADSPTDLTARHVMFNEANQLVNQFNGLESFLGNMRTQVNSQITTGVAEINRITHSIASLNENIVIEQGRSGGQPANDLLDQRDSLILELSDYVSLTTLNQDDGSINVLFGSGQPLVVGSHASAMRTSINPAEPNQINVLLQSGGSNLSNVTAQLQGGIMGGTINFRDNLLDKAINSLGLTAIGLADSFNAQHNKGMDLDGALGIDFFSVTQPQVLTVNGTSGNVSASISDVTQLTNLDYTIQFDAGAWSLTRNDTGQNVPMTGAGTVANPFIVDGVSIEVTATPVNGETYELRPTRLGARGIDMLLSNVNQIAVAKPIRSSSSINNTGSGVISSGEITDINNATFQTSSGQLAPPVLVRFTSSTSYDLLDNSNPLAPVVLEAGITYDPTSTNELYPTPGGVDSGYRMQINGVINAGDEFNVSYNTGGIGDNSNGLSIATLSSNKLLSGGTQSIIDSYRTLVVNVGISTRQAEQNSVVQQRVLDQVTATHDSVSGVNLDEEAAQLVRFQQAYQAAAQVVATANALFETLLAATRR